MLVSTPQNSCIGGIAQRDRPMRVFLRSSGIKALDLDDLENVQKRKLRLVIIAML